jgi:hypothetical protein
VLPAPAFDQLSEHRGRGPGVAQGGVLRHVLHAQFLHEPRQPRRLAAGQLEHQARERGGVDDGVVERPLEPAAHEPGVEGVMAVLHQDRAVRKTEEGAAGVRELGRADQHRALDLVTAAGVGVDRRPAVHQGVEEAQRPVEPEALRAQLQDQEGPVAGRLHVERDVLRALERRVRGHVDRVDRNLLPGHGLARSPRLQQYPSCVFQ